jgi:hypothetical protein
LTRANRVRERVVCGFPGLGIATAIDDRALGGREVLGAPPGSWTPRVIGGERIMRARPGGGGSEACPVIGSGAEGSNGGAWIGGSVAVESLRDATAHTMTSVAMAIAIDVFT